MPTIRKGVIRGQPRAPVREEPHLRDKDASTFTRVFRGLRHVGQEREQFRCELRVTKLSLRVPEPKRVNVEWVRGPKRLYSQAANTLHKGVWTCSWATPLVLTATLFYHEDGQAHRQYASKTTKIRFVDLGRQLENLGEVSFDLAEVAQSKERDVSITLPLHKSLDPNSTVSFSLKCIPIGDGSESGDDGATEGSGTLEARMTPAKARLGNATNDQSSPLAPAHAALTPDAFQASNDRPGLFRRRSMVARQEGPSERSLSFPPSIPKAESVGDEKLTESQKLTGGSSPQNVEQGRTTAVQKPPKGVSQPDIQITLGTIESPSRKAVAAAEPAVQKLDLKDPYVISIRDLIRGSIRDPDEEAKAIRLMSQKLREHESKHKHEIAEMEARHKREKSEMQKELKARAATSPTKEERKSEKKMKAAEYEFFEVGLARPDGHDPDHSARAQKEAAAGELREARKVAAERIAELEAFVLEQKKAFKAAKLTWEHRMAEMQNKVKSLEKQLQVHEQWAAKRAHDPGDERLAAGELLKLEEELRRLQLKRIEEKRLSSDEVRTHLAASKALKNELDLQRRKNQLFERTLKEKIAMLEAEVAELREARREAEAQAQSVEVSDAADYETMTRSELISRIRRLEGSPSTGKDQKRVADLEEELIRAKISVAQTETEKDQVIEQARRRIESLKAALQQYDKTVHQLEEQLTAAKMRQLDKKGGAFGMKQPRARGLEKDESPGTHHKGEISRTTSSDLPQRAEKTKALGRRGSHSDALGRNDEKR